MSRVIVYREPHQFSAGALALAVHAAFFSLLVFGMRWQPQAPEELTVELWDSLPGSGQPAEPTPAAPEQIVVADMVKGQVAAKADTVPAKADIELRAKKTVQAAPDAGPSKLSAKQLKAQRDEEELRQLAEYAETRRQQEQARVRAEVDAATAAEVGRFQDMIRGKIRRNIVMPPDVPESAVAEFKVTLLPGGMVMDAVLLKSSGSAAYDNAAERAIFKAQPLPLPADAGLQKLFRELRLTIRP